eukprot:c25532_g2_i2 orf=262-2265(+)
MDFQPVKSRDNYVADIIFLPRNDGQLAPDMLEGSRDGESGTHPLIQSLIDLVNEIGAIGEYRKVIRKECANLTRRVMLMVPLLEELKEFRQQFPQKALACFSSLERALWDAKELLRLCHDGSKIYLALKKETVIGRFLAVAVEMGRALDGLPYNTLGTSDEVREQAEFVHTQLKRAKARVDNEDTDFYNDLNAAVSANLDIEVVDTALGRLAENLELKTVSELKQESRVLHHMILGKCGENKKDIEQMFLLLKRLKDFTSSGKVSADTNDHDAAAKAEKLKSTVVPDDFRCPISLELMKDPVIVATGQTYERSCIRKWLDSGNKTCPKTQQVLSHLGLTPNYVLRSLIAQWCEIHGIDLPKKGSWKSQKMSGTDTQIPAGDQQTIELLLDQLRTGEMDVKRTAAKELRLLAKKNAENRVCIAEAGAIPNLVDLLSIQDLRMQEHAITALLNLSIHDSNKGAIVMAGAINPIVKILKSGSMEARENAAATLFSLSVVDENKVTIGASGAIPALVNLLQKGALRGKKEAATALFNLSIYQGNKARAVRAGVVPPLMELLTDPAAEMVDEALAILAIIATHQEGRVAIGQTATIPMLVDLIRTGSPRNKENGAAVLLSLCTNDSAHIWTARQVGASGPLSELAQSGTTRARRKAALLLDHINKYEQAAMR